MCSMSFRGLDEPEFTRALAPPLRCLSGADGALTRIDRCRSDAAPPRKLWQRVQSCVLHSRAMWSMLLRRMLVAERVTRVRALRKGKDVWAEAHGRRERWA